VTGLLLLVGVEHRGDGSGRREADAGALDLQQLAEVLLRCPAAFMASSIPHRPCCEAHRHPDLAPETTASPNPVQ